jgi:hypothetical protein
MSVTGSSVTRRFVTIFSPCKTYTVRPAKKKYSFLKNQIFHGLAIRRNLSSVAAMKEAIWAVLLHVSSSNKDCKHIFCPKTPDTWCKYHKAHLEGKTYNHNDHFHLSSAVMAVVKPIFKDCVILNCLRNA